MTTNPKYDAEPIISPDGSQIVFGSQRHGDFDIYIMQADGSNLRRLTDRVGYDGGPWFSHDGAKLVFASNRDPDKSRATDIYLADYIDVK